MKHLAYFSSRHTTKDGVTTWTSVYVDLTKISYIEKVSDSITKINIGGFKSIEVDTDFETVMKMWQKATRKRVVIL